MSNRPGIERLLLAELTLPQWHPRATDGTCSVFGYAVRHPDGVILFDTGVGPDSSFIDELYQPQVVPVATALARHGIDERDVVAVVNSHLHFDHCGQNSVFHAHGVPIHVQTEEVRAAQAFGYTVPEWAAIPDDAVRLVRGDEVIADGVTIIETVGHTPGHQSLVIETAEGRVVLGGQCAYCGDELTRRRAAEDNLHDESFAEAADQSIERVLELEPRTVALAHDARPWSPTRPA